MKAANRKSIAGARGAGLVAGVLGWTALLAIAGARMFFGMPRDDGILLAALAMACASLVTGATLLVLHALQTGFGALDSFFSAALARSAQRHEERSPPAAPEPPRRGYIGDRPFVANSDGSVMVETLLGPRLFPSLADAQDFVGS
ncbi:MAG TPA: hypothetical protein PKA55_03910 [Rhodoblastus sp.]|nr:hypothetical protein [Rhodoblastus sp.]